MERCDLDLLLLNKQEFTLISLLQNWYHPIVQGQRARKCSVGVLHCAHCMQRVKVHTLDDVGIICLTSLHHTDHPSLSTVYLTSNTF